MTAMEALLDVSRGLVIPNTMARALARMGWVTIRETKTDGPARKRLDIRLTQSGRAALAPTAVP